MTAPIATSDALVTDALHVVARVGAERFAFRVADVEEVQDSPAVLSVPAAPAGLAGQLLHREHTVPAFDSAWMFGVPRQWEAHTGGTALVLRSGPMRVALLVDDVDDLASLDVAALRPVPSGTDVERILRGLSVAPGQGAERLIGVVDVAALIARATTPLESLAERAR